MGCHAKVQHIKEEIFEIFHYSCAIFKIVITLCQPTQCMGIISYHALIVENFLLKNLICKNHLIMLRDENILYLNRHQN